MGLLYWNPTGVLGVTSMLVAHAMAAFVLFSRPDRAQNRRLAMVLFFDGLAFGMGPGLLYFMTEVRWAVAAQSLFYVSILVVPWLYLRLVATLDTPLARPFRNRPMDAILIVASILAPLLYFADRSQWNVEMTSTWYSRWEAVLGPAWLFASLFQGAVSLFALLAAVSAFRRATTPAARQRAKAFAIAFGTRDAIVFTLFFILPFVFPLPPSGRWTDMLYLQGGPFNTLLFVTLIGYGVLKTQLFDIDLKVKAGVRRAAVAAVFVVVFFVASEAVERVASARLGTVAGLAAAGLLAFALTPLQRVADRVADAAMPAVRATPDYLQERKHAVYAAALEGARQDGVVTERERAILERLRRELGLTVQEAAGVERGAAAA